MGFQRSNSRFTACTFRPSCHADRRRSVFIVPAGCRPSVRASTVYVGGLSTCSFNLRSPAHWRLIRSIRVRSVVHDWDTTVVRSMSYSGCCQRPYDRITVYWEERCIRSEFYETELISVVQRTREARATGDKDTLRNFEATRYTSTLERLIVRVLAAR